MTTSETYPIMRIQRAEPGKISIHDREVLVEIWSDSVPALRRVRELNDALTAAMLHDLFYFRMETWKVLS